MEIGLLGDQNKSNFYICQNLLAFIKSIFFDLLDFIKSNLLKIGLQ